MHSQTVVVEYLRNTAANLARLAEQMENTVEPNRRVPLIRQLATMAEYVIAFADEHADPQESEVIDLDALRECAANGITPTIDTYLHSGKLPKVVKDER